MQECTLLKDEKIHKVANRVKFLVLIETPGCRIHDATGLSGGDSRFFLASIGLVTLDATGLPGGGSRSCEERETPLGKPVASFDICSPREKKT